MPRSLTQSYLGQQGATGHRELGFALSNKNQVGRAPRSGMPESIYPGAASAGRCPPVAPAPPATSSTSTTLRHLKLGPGDTVSFPVGVTHVPTAGNRCTTAHQVQVVAPNDTATMRVQIR